MTRVSVVIPAYNEEQAIRPCLQALCAQRTSAEVEVIVADNSSTDRTAAIARSFRGRLDVRVVTEKRKGRGAARAAGFAAARGEIILSTDADTVVPPHWVETYLRLFAKHPDVDAVGGTSYIADCRRHTNLAYNLLHPCVLAGFRLLYGHDWLSGFNFGIRARAYNASGGFDPVTDSFEDYDLSRRVGRIGRTKVFRAVRVRMSGRRFRKGIVVGMVPYMVNLWERAVLRRTRVILSDVR